jgi:hypothetical protein
MSNREIKFRAWHKQEAEMLASNFQSHYFRWREEGQPIEIMQYTGLKDKNGKEIYEGDIVEGVYPFSTALMLEVAAVTWHVSKGAWVLGGHVGGTRQVIGNIYENPDLIGE